MLYVGLDHRKRYAQVSAIDEKGSHPCLEHRVQMDRTFQERIGTIQAGIRKERLTPHISGGTTDP